MYVRPTELSRSRPTSKGTPGCWHRHAASSAKNRGRTRIAGRIAFTGCYVSAATIRVERYDEFMSEWIVKRGTLERRVPDLATLIRLAQERRLKRGDLVFHPDRQEWLAAADVPEIGAALIGADATPSNDDAAGPAREGSPLLAPASLTGSAAEPSNAPAASAPTKDARRSPSTLVTPIVLLLLSACVTLLAWPLFKPAAHREALTRWEYTVVAIPDAGFQAAMNKLGDEGWELVFARRASDGSRYDPEFSYEVILKRPKQSASAASPETGRP